MEEDKNNSSYLDDLENGAVVLDQDDYEGLNIEDSRHELFLDLAVLRFRMDDGLSFLNALNSPNEEVFIQSSSWSRPCIGHLTGKELKGHTYHFGRISNKYDLFIGFEPSSGNCECSDRNNEMHVPVGTKTLIADLVDDCLQLVSPVNSSYFASNDTNSYVSSAMGYNLKFHHLSKGRLHFSNLDSVSFFAHHNPYWIVACLGQNDVIDPACSATFHSELSRLFCLEKLVTFKFSIAINVKIVTDNNDARSVILPELGFKKLFGDTPCTSFDQYTKAFQKDISNFQSIDCPIDLDEELDDHPNFTFQSLNWYNGMFNILKNASLGVF